jgi:hypothetical protein
MSSVLMVLYYNTIRINRFIIDEFDLTKDFQGPSLDPTKFDIRVMDYKELSVAIACRENLPREFGMHDIHGVKYCTLITSENKICHISWIYLNGDKNRCLDLAIDEAQVNYSFTFPEFRGLALFPQALLASAEWLKQRGYKRIIMAGHEGTIFMRNSLNKIEGVKRIGTLTQWFLYRPKFRSQIHHR